MNTNLIKWIELKDLPRMNNDYLVFNEYHGLF